MAFEPYIGYGKRVTRHMKKAPTLAVAIQKTGCFTMNEITASKINSTSYIYVERDLVTKQVRFRAARPDEKRAKSFRRDVATHRYRIGLKYLLYELEVTIPKAETLKADFDGEWLTIDLKHLVSRKASQDTLLSASQPKRRRMTKGERLEEALQERHAELPPNRVDNSAQVTTPAFLSEVPVTPAPPIVPETPSIFQSTLLQLMDHPGGENILKELSSLLQQHPKIVSSDPQCMHEPHQG